MEKVNVFSQRLKNARIMRGFSMSDLCNRLDIPISKMAISKYETGSLKPGSTAIINFAKALELPVDYFFKPFSFSFKSIKFRKKAGLPEKKLNSIKKEISDFIERYLEIEDTCALQIKFENPFKSRVLTKNDVIRNAKKLREVWNLGSDGIVNVIELLEERGIKVLEIDADSKFDGFSTFINEKYPLIVLNKNFLSERKRFTALHELSHILFRFPSFMNEKEQEVLCNLFASEMLIPENIFSKLLGIERHDISYMELKAIQKQYGISCDALMYKAKELNIISENRHKFYCIAKNKNPAFKSQVEKSLYPDETSMRFERLVYRALSDELISTSKAASLLGHSVARVRKDLSLV